MEIKKCECIKDFRSLHGIEYNVGFKYRYEFRNKQYFIYKTTCTSSESIGMLKNEFNEYFKPCIHPPKGGTGESKINNDFQQSVLDRLDIIIEMLNK